MGTKSPADLVAAVRTMYASYRLWQWAGVPKEVALAEEAGVLAERYSEAQQRVGLGLSLDSFGDHDGIGLSCEVAHSRGHGLARRIRIDIADDRDVEFDEVGAQFKNVAQARKSGSRIVHRQLAIW